jgi:hypothetical protein
LTVTTTTSTSGLFTNSSTLAKARGKPLSLAALIALSWLLLATPTISKSSASARRAGI